MRHRRRQRYRTALLAASLVTGLIAVVTVVLWGPTHSGSGSGSGGSSDQAASGPLVSSAPASPTAASPSGSPSPSASPTKKAATKSPTATPTPRATPKPHPTTPKSVPVQPAPPVAVPAGYRTVTLANRLPQTVWVAATQSADHHIARSGWVLKPGQSASVAVPGDWGGRFWGRTGCSFDAAGKGSCQTGDCGVGLQCQGSGAPPATLAELALGAWGGMDFYDVSMVDGSNLPMYINISHTATKDPVSSGGCSSGGCTKPVDCPAKMQVKAGGKAVACTTPCEAFGGDAYCCRNAWAGRENCVPSKWPVDYTQVFKKAEPYAYSYAFDDSATMSCKGACNYRITFGYSS